MAEGVEQEADVPDLIDLDLLPLAQGTVFSPPRVVRPEVLSPPGGRRRPNRRLPRRPPADEPPPVRRAFRTCCAGRCENRPTQGGADASATSRCPLVGKCSSIRTSEPEGSPMSDLIARRIAQGAGRVPADPGGPRRPPLDLVTESW